jgi:hypothetical protein
MYCVKCKSQNPPNANYCAFCGCALENSGQQNSGASLQTPTANPPNFLERIYTDQELRKNASSLKKSFKELINSLAGNNNY